MHHKYSFRLDLSELLFLNLLYPEVVLFVLLR